MPTSTTRTLHRQRFAVIAGRQVLALLAVCILLWIAKDRIASIDLVAVKIAVEGVGIWQWAVAAAATYLSFLAVGHYDAILHGLLGTGTNVSAARRSGIIAIATSQFAGFGVLTGALVRWRLLPHLSLWQTTRLSLAVSMSFLAGWAVFTASVVLLAPASATGLTAVALIVTLCSICLVFASLWQPPLLPKMPSVKSMLSILTFVAIDTSLAGFALWVLLPPGMDVAPLLLLQGFLLALGVGLIGGTPGGIGPFEVTLLAALPMVPSDPLLGAVLAFRLIYYAIPALIAAACVLKGGRPDRQVPDNCYLPPAKIGITSPALETAMWEAPLAEAVLLRRGEIGLLKAPAGSLSMALDTGQSLVLYREAFAGQHHQTDRILAAKSIADARGLSPLLYKCLNREAAIARRKGWAVFPISREALLRPSSFDAAGPGRRQLRRMLRKAEAAGITVFAAGNELPLAEMSAISAGWVTRHGRERGVFVGRFDPDTLHGQKNFLAYSGRTLVAFATFNEVAEEWSLDLMRQSDAAANGTMHLLIVRAISAAAAAGVPRLSLAAVPRHTAFEGWLPKRFQTRFSSATGAIGLHRFKASFDPVWKPLYAAAPTRFQLLLGLVEVARTINSTRRH